MSLNWSSGEVKGEFKDVQANTMSVDCHGKLAVLAGRRMIALVNIDDHTSIVRLPRQSKYDVSAVEWNRHPSLGQLVALSSNNRMDIMEYASDRLEAKHSMKHHSRVITDMDWSPFEPNFLASCSVDTFTLVWDLRQRQLRPSLALQGIAGVSQVKWNRLDSHLLATTHDGDVRVWDLRKGTSPVQYIAGHLSKIHGLDWCPQLSESGQYQLATSSQDSSVKFWDLSQPRQCVFKIPNCGSPVWRARYTPFGQCMVTVVVPQLSRSENSVFMWNLQDLTVPVHTFVGHTDVVLDFHWRKCESDDTAYELITWSRDQSMRLWRLNPPDLNEAVVEFSVASDGTESSSGSANGVHMIANISPAARLAATPERVPPPASIQTKSSLVKLAKTSAVTIVAPPSPERKRTVSKTKSSSRPKSLHNEFILINFDMDNLNLEEMDPVSRVIIVTATNAANTDIVQLKLSFPADYPNGVPPVFKINSASVDSDKQAEIIKQLEAVAMNYVEKDRSCIEPCLRYLTQVLEKVSPSAGIEGAVGFENSYSAFYGRSLPKPTSMLPYALYQDAAIPFPRTSGARFCSVGYLVCFTRKITEPILNTTTGAPDVTPRAMAALSAYGTQGTRIPVPGVAAYMISATSARGPPTDSGIYLQNFYKFRDKSLARRVPQRTRTSSRSLKDREVLTLNSQKKVKVGHVIIYDTTALLPINKYLAEHYVNDPSHPQYMCSTNAKLAQSVGRPDLAKLWHCLALMLKATAQERPGDYPFAQHPFGRKMVQTFLDHYVALHDMQAVSMITCALGTHCEGNIENLKPSPCSSDSGTSSQTIVMKHYWTVHGTDTSRLAGGWNLIHDVADRTAAKFRRSNSWSQLCEESVAVPAIPAKSAAQAQNDDKLLNPETAVQYDLDKNSYGNVLFALQLCEKRCEVLKFLNSPEEPHKGLEVRSVCRWCSFENRTVQCQQTYCRRYVLYCSLCQLPVKGRFTFCTVCGHGGHVTHMQDWFLVRTVCPTGCGCECVNSPRLTDQQQGAADD